MFTNTLRNLVLAGAAYALVAVSTVSADLDDLNPICIDMFGSNQQPRVPFETRTQNAEGTVTYLSTAPAIFPEGDTFGPEPPNLLETKYEEAGSCRGNPIPNTLPSTPENPYNLHPDPVVTAIDKTSPTDDLDWLMDKLEAMVPDDKGKDGHNAKPLNRKRVARLARHAVDIIEGNPLSGRLVGRVYEGFPLLHYLGGLKTKSVDPVTKTVTINQIWYDSHIEADTNYIDPHIVDDEEWTIVYNLNMLNRSHDDFAPYAMFFDDPDELDLMDVGGPNLEGARIPNVGMDQTFFPMEEGLRYTYEMKMPPARFWNLTYHWGWRLHPPRVQVVENQNVLLRNGEVRNSAEIGVFGANPLADEEAKMAAIDMIGDHAPAKRMWRMFGEIAQLAEPHGGKYRRKHNHKHHGKKLSEFVRARIPLIRQAFYDWQNRNKLPTGFMPDPDADVNVLFINNTMYGEVKGHDGDAEVRIDGLWNKRGDKVRVNLLNGDYYVHAYVLVDFGGLRGFENLFHNTLPIGGAGPLFSFGRNYFWVHVAGDGPIPVPPAQRSEEPYYTSHVESMEPYYKKKGHVRKWKNMSIWGDLMDPVAEIHTAQGIGQHTVEVTFNYEPSRRLRMYQFDALHHDVSIWSIH